MKALTFPLEIKAGSSRVKIYRVVEPHRERFTLSYHEGTRRQLKQFAALADARREAKTIAERLNAGQGEILALSGKDRDSFQHAKAKLRALDIPLADAIDEYVAAKAIGVPLLAAAKFYHEAHSSKLPDKTVSEIVTEFLTAKKADGRSVRYLQDCKARLERFQRDFKVNLKDVRTQDLDAWLRRLKLAPRTRNNFRTVICSLFSFARDAGYLIKGKPTEAETTALAKQGDGEIEVFTPNDFSTLLLAADEHLLPFLIFGGMAGLRSAEILRLKWEDVNWPESVIEIHGRISKTGGRRLAPLVPAAAAWLNSYKDARGPVIGHIKLYERLEKLSESTDVPWRQNALRHSFCSYRMATLRDAPRVSYEAGNSVRIIQRHYDKVVTESQGKAWFAIMPETADNVVQIAKGAA
jgi:integrase